MKNSQAQKILFKEVPLTYINSINSSKIPELKNLIETFLNTVPSVEFAMKCNHMIICTVWFGSQLKNSVPTCTFEEGKFCESVSLRL